VQGHSTIIRIFLAGLLIPLALVANGQTEEPTSTRDTTNFNTEIDSTASGLIVVEPDTVMIEEGPIEEIITYPATDSTVYDIAEQRVRMYNAAKVTYGTITLESDYIEYDFIKGSVLAYGQTDSLGQPIGRPVFTENGQSFTADTIRYNFESKKGVIKEVRTNDGESYVHAEVSKKQENDHIHNLGGKYTTCSQEDPHYHFRFKKMIVIPDDKVITGPVYMKLGKIPTPLALPFGFFPNTTEQKQGILIPSYGFSDGLGYFLIDGGYYIPVNEHWDTKLTADIYSRGTWGGRNLTRYFNKYRYNGNIDLSFTNRLTGDRELLNFSKTQSFFLRWSHTQDRKARPSTSFSANVNMGTSNNFSTNLNSSQNDFISNTFGSGVSYTKQFSTSRLSANLRQSQNTQSRSFNLTLPQITFNKNRFFVPLGWMTKNGVKARKLDNILGINYSSQFENTLVTTEPELRFDNLERLRGQLKNGVSHTIRANSSIKLGHFTLNPNASYNERWHFAKTQEQFDFGSGEAVTDTVNGFFTTRDYNLGADLTTKIYGMSTFKGDGIQAIRLVMTPSVGYSLAPEQSFFQTYEDTVSVQEYNPFMVSAYSQGNIAERSAITFGLVNSLEMKVKTGRDSVATTKKVKLIENFSVRSNYNLAAEKFQLAIFNVAARTTLFKNVSLQYSGTFDPYAVDDNGARINEFRYKTGGPIVRNTSNTFALSTALSGGEGKKKRNPLEAEFVDDNELEEIENNRRDYVDFNIPWKLNLSYTLNTRKSYLPKDEGGRIDTTIVAQHGIAFNGNFRVLEKWKVGFTSGYDVVDGDWTPTNLTLSWDLHCWEFTGNVIPFGQRKSYNIRIGIKASVLQDLKLQKRGNLDSGANTLPF